MADFSVNATQLSDPNMAGSQPVQAVQQQYLNTSAINLPIVNEVVEVFQRGLVNSRKDQAKAMENEVVGRFSKEEAMLNQAFATGQITASEHSVRSRSNFSKYMASYGQYAGALEGAAKALKGYSEKGQAEDQLQLEADLRKSALTNAQSKGYFVDAGQTKAEQDVIIRASQSQIRLEEQMAQQYKAAAERRAIAQQSQSETTFENSLADRQNKEVARQGLVALAGDHMGAFQATAESLVRDVSGGKKTPQEAQAILAAQYGRVQSGIVAISGTNTELIGPYRTLFSETNTVFQEMLKPGANVDQLQNQVKAIIARGQLSALQASPKFAAAVAISPLLGHNPTIALEVNGEVPGVLATVAQTPITGNAPQVVGTGEVETGVLKVLKSSIQTLPLSKTDKASLEAATSINHVLKQTSTFLDRGANSENLKGLATFFASPEYAKVVKSGMLDQQGATAAYKTFQLSYEPAVGKAVTERLNSYLQSAASTKTTPTTVSESLDVQFNGSGVTFVPKNLSSLDSNERASQQDAIRSLQPASRAITQLVQMSAHLNGSTDYAGEWEKRKHIWLPKMYSPYTNLNIGDVKSGMRYTGGDSKDPANWTKVESGQGR